MNYKEYLKKEQARVAKARLNCKHLHKKTICSDCGKVVGSEVCKKCKGIVADTTMFSEEVVDN